ncbi:MAG TPA: D-alanyl-D-alanine carboxypeptidase/D-alanyl-D-alanine-endopeptidase [Blastocatellia bacterium]|nr:D-alanyl-D-alanine carboxypeptidase/D-alanyl-D-alanine-endopeptidase [Blastocatellia bacterium]
MKQIQRTAALLIGIALLWPSALAQQIPAVAVSAKPQTLVEMQERIAALLDQPKFAAARWGARILTADGRIIYEQDADKTFIPASNLKLYTSAAALDAFGPDFKIKTSVYATKPVKAGLLRGDLILYGRGDPNLSPRFETEDPLRYSELKPADRIGAIEQLADQIAARGIKTVLGNLIGEDSYFAGDPLGPGWEWDDSQFYYGAEISALSANDNCVTFTVTPARKLDQKPVIKAQPQTGYVKVINQVTTSAGGPTRIGVRREPNGNTVEFFGSIPRQAGEFLVDVAVHDPASFAATLLKEALERRGISIKGTIKRLDANARASLPFDESKLIEIASVESQKMSELIKVINKQSQNLHTELMLRQLGARQPEATILDDYGRPRATDLLGNEIRKQFLQRAGIEIGQLSLRDGSGLSRHNLVSPHSTSQLLQVMLTHPQFGPFRESLVIAGADGTLERRMRDTPAANNFRGKTGSLSYVNSLSGYLTTKRGQLLIVSLMGNNYVGPGRDVTAVMDQICAMLADFEGPL